MMNDRFSAQLRQHLLAAGDERPADGQIAAVVERVAVTGQRHPLVARLTWSPGRIGPFPSAALRYGLIALALLAAAMAVAILGGGSGPSGSTVFDGTWTSIDPADDSTLTIVVGKGTSPAVRFEDAFAAGDACVADAVKLFTADGAAEISGNRIDITFPDGGGCGLRKVRVPDIQLHYDAVADKLRDSQGVGWVRVRGS